METDLFSIIERRIHMETKNLSTLELNQLIAEKASENEDFRLALLSDPKSALEKECAVTFPEGLSVKVHVDSSQELHLIIPATKLDELSDDQLEDVAGGVMAHPGAGAIVCVYGVPNPGGLLWKWPKK